MTASTEQERASLSAFIEMAEREGFDTAHQWYDAKGWVFFSPSTADCWRYWQAARRAPAVPVQQGWTDQLEQVLCDLQVGPYPSIALAVKRIEGLLAAAPQPPEAAPVELPEPVYTMRVRGRMHDYTPTLSAFDLADGEHKLYTEQQVRKLLAAAKVERKPLTEPITHAAHRPTWNGESWAMTQIAPMHNIKVDQLKDHWMTCRDFSSDAFTAGIRYAERAHGIGKDKA